MKKPTQGIIVIYNATPEDKMEMAARGATKQDTLPAIVTANPTIESPSPSISLKIELDGPGQLYKAGVPMGDGPGQWSWPVILDK